MSDLSASHDDGALEPDEDILISALRNQDDIPILMDVVTDQVASSLSQAEHLAHSLEESMDEMDEGEALLASRENVAAVISSVLQKRLPELVEEVMLALKVAAEQKN